MRKLFFLFAFVLGAGVIMSASSNTTKNNLKRTAFEQMQITPSYCVQFARYTTLNYADANDMGTSSSSPEYDYLIGVYMILYKYCLEETGYIN